MEVFNFLRIMFLSFCIMFVKNFGSCVLDLLFKMINDGILSLMSFIYIWFFFSVVLGISGILLNKVKFFEKCI